MQPVFGSVFPATIVFDDVDPAELALEEASSTGECWAMTPAWQDYVRRTLGQRGGADIEIVSASVIASVEGAGRLASQTQG